MTRRGTGQSDVQAPALVRDNNHHTSLVGGGVPEELGWLPISVLL